MKYNYTDKATRKKAWIAILIIPTIALTYILYQKYQLKTHLAKTFGIISKKQPYKSGFDFDAIFVVNSNTYTSKYSWSSKDNFLESVQLGDTVTIEYSSVDPTVNEIVFRQPK